MINSHFVLFLLLAGCSTNASICPSIRQYSRSEQLQQANAEEKLPAGSALEQPLLEWASLRSQLRACQ